MGTGRPKRHQLWHLGSRGSVAVSFGMSSETPLNGVGVCDAGIPVALSNREPSTETGRSEPQSGERGSPASMAMRSSESDRATVGVGVRLIDGSLPVNRLARFAGKNEGASRAREGSARLRNSAAAAKRVEATIVLRVDEVGQVKAERWLRV